MNLLPRTVSTGIPHLDEELRGGYSFGKSFLIYGEEESGKTSLALKALANAVSLGVPSIWIACSGMLHPERIKQVQSRVKGDWEQVLFTASRTFTEQERIVAGLIDTPPPANSLIVADDFNYQHRVELVGDPHSDAPLFKRLNFQAAVLKNLSVERDSIVLIIGQIHEVPETGQLKPIASRILTFWSDVALKTENMRVGRSKLLTVEKDTSPGRRFRFRVTDSGISHSVRI